MEVSNTEDSWNEQQVHDGVNKKEKSPVLCYPESRWA